MTEVKNSQFTSLKDTYIHNSQLTNIIQISKETNFD